MAYQNWIVEDRDGELHPPEPLGDDLPDRYDAHLCIIIRARTAEEAMGKHHARKSINKALED